MGYSSGERINVRNSCLLGSEWKTSGVSRQGNSLWVLAGWIRLDARCSQAMKRSSRRELPKPLSQTVRPWIARLVPRRRSRVRSRRAALPSKGPRSMEAPTVVTALNVVHPRRTLCIVRDILWWRNGGGGCGGGRGKVEVGDGSGECGGGRSKVEEGDGMGVVRPRILCIIRDT